MAAGGVCGLVSRAWQRKRKLQVFKPSGFRLQKLTLQGGVVEYNLAHGTGSTIKCCLGPRSLGFRVFEVWSVKPGME